MTNEKLEYKKRILKRIDDLYHSLSEHLKTGEALLTCQEIDLLEKLCIDLDNEDKNEN